MRNQRKLGQIFKRFAIYECKGSSSLYALLSQSIAEDSDLLELAANCRNGLPTPNLFLGAVNFIRQREGESHLSSYYSLTKAVDHDLYPAFKEFALSHKTEVINLLKTRRVQTNEVNRSTYIYPMLCEIHKLANRPLAVVEIGAAAGLNLCCDRYRYEAGDLIYGDLYSELTLRCEFRSPFPYGEIKPSPILTRRVAIDINTIDMNKEEDRNWMKALIWPEHLDRQKRFDTALSIARQTDIEYVEGNGVDLLEGLLTGESADTGICVFHTHVANQMTAEDRARLVAKIDSLSSRYNVFHLYNNIGSAMLQLVHYAGGERRHLNLADTEGHGKWVRWTGERLC